ncbi:MAG: response regulator, partial [Myxococcales bacterium]|nr:response regulator [Myxococcales bacterium]
MWRWAEGSPRRRAVVLLVEADPGQAAALGQLLATRYEVRTANDGDEAIERVRSAPPDLVLSEARLPHGGSLADPKELSRELRSRGVPVVFVSAPSDELSAECLDSGAADFVAKPAGPRELVARVERAIRLARERACLEALAQTDALTGLANFRGLVRRAEHEYQRAVRYGHPLSAVTIDLDRLKETNDRYG